MSTKLFNVGVYIRLSKESTAYVGEDSLSIDNQQAMLSKFIDMMPGWTLKRTYIDDGATGGNFNRQGFRDMMEDARSGAINLVLVQDLSRFSRNYLEAGKYLEEELPELGCRFVALSDGIDTEDGENDIMPFLNAMNDYYLKNLSDRIKSVLTAKAKDGQKLSGAAPYGYDRDPANHTRLVVDEYAAGVVKHIFELRADGIGYSGIAGVLNKEGITPPRLYYFRRQKRETTAACSSVWMDRAVKQMLQNEIYLGHTVAFKRKSHSYRDSRQALRDESEWIRTENTHTPIIANDLWDKVQLINEGAKMRADNNREPQPSLFSKLLVCADCQTKMIHTICTKNYSKGPVRYNAYHCRTHVTSGRSVCSWHRISEPTLKKLVLGHIKEMAGQIALDEGWMLQNLQDKLIGANRTDKPDRTRERRELRWQLHTLETQVEQFYEDKISGAISSEAFTALAEKTEAEREEIQDRLTALEQTTEHAETKLADIKRWVRLIKEKSTFDEVDRDLLESLIDKIEVGEKKMVEGEKVQDVWIFYKYAGLC